MRAEMTGGRDSQSNICTFGFTKTKPWTVRAITKFQPAWEKPVEFPWSSGQVISYTVNSHNQADIEGDRVGNISDVKTEKIFQTKMQLQIQMVITSLVITACQSFVFQDSSDSPGQ